MSPVSTRQIDRTDGRLNRIRAGLLFHEETLTHADRAGIDDPFVLYAGGRAGVMGDFNSSQVTEAGAAFRRLACAPSMMPP